MRPYPGTGRAGHSIIRHPPCEQIGRTQSPEGYRAVLQFRHVPPASRSVGLPMPALGATSACARCPRRLLEMTPVFFVFPFLSLLPYGSLALWPAASLFSRAQPLLRVRSLQSPPVLLCRATGSEWGAGTLGRLDVGRADAGLLSPRLVLGCWKWSLHCLDQMPLSVTAALGLAPSQVGGLSRLIRKGSYICLKNLL